ncbi:hypothetical protein Daesc_009949 [Daldinia eschscholtzii]|uniref:Protein kinase domain-containing protein n=1 Tax=Daldinia eschscholtzii TaxID=292717 RepID=A0AAX6M6K1_9PEZI
MSYPTNWPFHHEGIIIERSEFEEGAEILIEWSENPDTLKRGFILLGGIKISKVFLLQSIATKEILICKVLDQNAKKRTEWIPPEFRISTAPYAVNFRLPRPSFIKGRERIDFNELVAIQKVKTKDHILHNLCFRFCNGGNLKQMIEKYNAVALSHRDMYLTNVFIHYLPRTGGRKPRLGRVTNAFPEIVVGDFGEAAMTDWLDEWLTGGVYEYDSDELLLWEDLLVQAHIPFALDSDTDDRPMIYPVRTVNSYITPPDNPYSEELIEMLNCFEYPFYNQLARPDDVRVDADGVSRFRYEWIPEFDEIEHIWLPIMRRRVKRYRGIVAIPDNYYETIDVSWSKPNHLMPYEPPPIPRPSQQRAQSEGPPQSQQSQESQESQESQQYQQDQQDQAPDTPIAPNAVLTELRGIPHLQKYQHRLLIYKNPQIDEASINPPPGPLPPPPPGGDSGESDSESDDDYESPEPDDDEEDEDYVP